MRFQICAWCSHCKRSQRADIGPDPTSPERITEILRRHRRGIWICPGSGTDANPQDIASLIERSSLGTPEAKAIRALTPPEVRDEILRRVGQQLGAAVEHPIAGTIYPHEAPCSSYLPDGRSEICAHCDWAEEAHT